MPPDIHFFLGTGDIKHLNNILQDDKNNFKFFHQLGSPFIFIEGPRRE
jgi:hypothetical protein